MADRPCHQCPKMFRTASGLKWHTDRQHPKAANYAEVRDETHVGPDGVSDSTITPPWTESVEKIQRVGQDAQTPDRAALVWVLKRELASVGFVVDSLSDIVDALEGTEREPQGWSPNS